MTAIFEYEKTVADLLTAANIPGLNVEVSADMSESRFRTMSKPTAIVGLGEELATSVKGPAAIAEVAIQVWLVIRGANVRRTPEDLFLREEIFHALHDTEAPGLNSPLEWHSTSSDFEDNARTYLLTFTARLLKRKRLPVGAL